MAGVPDPVDAPADTPPEIGGVVLISARPSPLTSPGAGMTGSPIVLPILGIILP